MNLRSKTPRIVQIVALLFAVLLAAPLAVAGQTGPTVPTEELPRTITITGTGIVEIAPDTADIIFGVYSQNESLEAAQDDNSTRLESIMQVFIEAGVPDEDVATSNYSINVINEYDRDGNLIGVLGYEVWSSLTVTIRDISIVGTVLDDAVAAGANEISSISFYVDNTDAAASQARVAAIDDARAKADEMAEASSVIVVGVYSIEETSAPEPFAEQYDMAMPASEGDSEEMTRAVPIAPGQTSVMVDVRVVFEIEQPQG
jgi:uncharacterized protein YggE